MHAAKKNRIKQLLIDVLKYIPETPPLQGFVANNPLWSLIDKPIHEATESANTMANITFILPIHFYWNWYSNDTTNESFIRESIATFVKKQQAGTASLDQFEQAIFQFVISQQYQTKLIDALNLNKTQREAHQILLSSQIKSYENTNLLEEIKSSCLDWLAVYFNPTSRTQKNIIRHTRKNQQKDQASYPFFEFLKTALCAKNRKWKKIFSDAPRDIEAFIDSAINDLLIPKEKIKQYLLEISWQLKGWIGYTKWQQNNPNNPYATQAIKPDEIIAMWLCHELFWFKTHKSPDLLYKTSNGLRDKDIFLKIWQDYSRGTDFETQKFSLSQLRWIWQRAYELSYETPLYHRLLSKKSTLEKQNDGNTTLAQWVFCIDVRSEGLRRHIEQQGKHETFGYAGFFGVAHELIDKDKHKLTHQCPVILKPELQIEWIKSPEGFETDLKNRLSSIIKHVRKSLFSSFALYEVAGAFASVVLIIKNFTFRYTKLVKQFSGKDRNANNSATPIKAVKIHQPNTEKMTALARGLLKGIGLEKDFSRLVVICGHSATTENNPYQAALDCGACGGNSGMSNAVLACEILNNPDVRVALSQTGVTIPDDTIFIAACHDTTTDEIIWKPSVSLSDQQQALMNNIKKDAMIAGQQLQAERLESLPGNRDTICRSKDWAELIPEWGLANNAAMIIAPRKLTQSLDLERRTFLHSYENESDSDGSVLTAILLGPVVVAHWINSQYYFSSVDPEHYCSGNKAIHNVLPNVGVMEGNQSDLKYGLPEQSLFYRGKNVHQPIRLCVFIDADQKKIDAIINQHKTLNDLVNGEWIYIRSLGTHEN